MSTYKEYFDKIRKTPLSNKFNKIDIDVQTTLLILRQKQANLNLEILEKTLDLTNITTRYKLPTSIEFKRRYLEVELERLKKESKELELEIIEMEIANL
jgi:hypothetical protein